MNHAAILSFRVPGVRYVDVYVSWERQTLTYRSTEDGPVCAGWMPHHENSPKSPSTIARRFGARKAERLFGIAEPIGEILWPRETGGRDDNTDIVPVDDSAIGNFFTPPQFRHNELQA